MFPFFRKKSSTLTARKRDVPDGLWTKCPSCSELVYRKQMHRDHGICAKCGFHFPIGAAERIEMLLENKSFEEWDAGLESVDSLEFTGTSSYVSKLESNMKKTGRKDAVICGRGRIGEHAVALAVMDFDFLAASMGAVVGEKITRLIERATAERLPVVIVCASGGARMYEGLFSLMQMAKTSGALARHAAAGLPYIPVLTHPTTAGVMASFATLGDVIVAEPDALIGFAGPRVIKETTQQDLPDGFQKSEFLLKHGLLDMVVNRKELKSTLIQLLDYFRPHRQGEAKAS
ncbi:MAG TPA: acetyl-CoA carboxylase, carboxyltransferase subunit beta [Kiritimatiellia bacterium]|nr:acetyl-CoA carboxylase, carboxyltransferase subunit beta [Kiritimatiellia bacterium]HNR93138.1 acetyl-CoA carboxylase, carboxyltransferase subunit beta [Kiritimatiellia bacterium]HNS80768.1 acetyl-CoA carboxylase, carboxyltransferase subunit beta [Kiritimatiellia bacterium]HPA78895.1 acetyl-CoA carboxylase, carboxyltransferase subunit beta [Kiritimatiellia bacterium]HQQ05061.1 acetyl-CoA carboxylase, carboxyltransferase subunit beta [Kiritimatiellia bacterium]